MRDHTKLKAFHLAEELALQVYGVTRGFLREELFCLTMQMRRAAVSIAANIVEGCARNTQSDYVHFLDIAYGSARELQYQLSLAMRLSYVPTSSPVLAHCDQTTKVLNSLIRALRRGD